MTTYIILNVLVLILIASSIGYLFYKKKNDSKSIQPETTDAIAKITKLGTKVYLLLIITLVLILASCFAPFIFTREAINDDFNFQNTGQIGDTIGGLMNPFITLAGVIVTGLAFYIQYRANVLQREFFVRQQEQSRIQFQGQLDAQKNETAIQQFEAQFYQMLNFHRDNISEMKIEGYDFEEGGGAMKEYYKATEGRKVFVTMKTELESIIVIYKSIKGELDQAGFEKCYKLFFSGLDEFKTTYPNEKELEKKFEDLRDKHEFPNKHLITTNNDRKKVDSDIHLNFNYKPFSGHASRLGHYFRHLFLTVKSVIKSDVTKNYKEEMRYLKVLRAQLSNHEQILLFYNWISGYGGAWEDEKNQFFTEYKIVHNLWYTILLDDPFIKGKVDYLRNRPIKNRKGNMFEID